MENEQTRHGRCLCGRVRFSARGRLREAIACHCNQCRRQTGHFVVATRIEPDKLTVEGGAHLTWFRSSRQAERGFCSRCGSLLFWRMDGRAAVSVMAGAFDQPTGLTLAKHIFVADKGDYYAIDDGLPQHQHSSPDVPVAARAPESCG